MNPYLLVTLTLSARPSQSMGSQSSSGMSCGRGSSSDNPADRSDGSEPNQSSSSSSRGRRSADRQQGDRQSASEEDVDLAEVLAYLLRRWSLLGFIFLLLHEIFCRKHARIDVLRLNNPAACSVLCNKKVILYFLFCLWLCSKCKHTDSFSSLLSNHWNKSDICKGKVNHIYSPTV